jgi:hypothetical protein
MNEPFLKYGWDMNWNEIQYNYYSLMDYWKNNCHPDDLWSRVPLE